MTRVDRYLRREDTYVARFLRNISSKTGGEYRESRFKRVTDVLVATPTAIVSLPITTLLAAAKKLEDGGSSFYFQERIGRDGKPVEIIKIRCMRMDADSDIWASLHNASVFGEENDPRNTKFGGFMRKFELEELPQLWQVVSGKLSLVDIRSAPQYVIDYIRQERPDGVDEWKNAYFSGTPGLFSLNSAVNHHRKDDTKRHHYDMLYAKKASLGLDLFVFYRTGLRMFRRLVK